MCHICNANYTQNGGYNTTTTGGCFGFGQRVCRDCCGNVWVRRNVCNPCCQQTGCHNVGTGTTDTTNNGNGGTFGCFTICGRVFQNTVRQTPVTTEFDGYYARQYGLYPYGGRGCGCGGNAFTND
jgi:hypothetical protein